ncbi:LacI family DNA-binding transcriptional regulator [Clostridium sp. DJ247]|uniref:LacI family DNA-binding transcriptional regulator n=1 Tax=Clostridium sp. DJ247 TaxID=2726188 RepID=UPI0016238F9C|nr:LacI family DNA-binding transcriptional regulator [Clostridium sp. DJ247]MBC2579508.1 LacI family transcriptional regulator [Clostridium sp. DJ247]
MKPTIKHVAKKANVSVATVSRILNNNGRYSEETKERVLSIIKEIGYERNDLARGLITKSTKTIGVLVPSVSTVFFAEILNGIEDTAHRNNYSVVICNTGENGKRTLEYLKVLSAKQVDGIILTSLPLVEEYYKTIIDLRLPCVLVSTMSYKYQLPYVKVDDRQAAYTATQYLIENGHKKIAIISGSRGDAIAGEPRVNGYMEALSYYGLEINKKLIKYGDFAYKSGKLCMEQLLDEGQDFTAVFGTSDEMAVGALSVAHSKGIKVPDEISIVGYDNTQIAEMAIPALTTVAQPLYQMGEKSTKKLLSIIETGETVESTIMMHKIVERSTVKKI